jgi:hypothetical protein
MGPLLTALTDTPRVAANVCWVISVTLTHFLPSHPFALLQLYLIPALQALNNIAESFRDEEVKPAENFKPYFETSVLGLLNAAERYTIYMQITCAVE